MQSNSDANRILYRVLTDFKEAIESQVKLKNIERIKGYRSKLFNYRQNRNGTLEFSGITLRPYYHRSYNEERLSVEMLQRDYWTVEISPVTECVLQVLREQSHDQPARPKKRKREEENELEHEEESPENPSNSLLQDGVDQMYHCSNPELTAKFCFSCLLKKA